MTGSRVPTRQHIPTGDPAATDDRPGREDKSFETPGQHRTGEAQAEENRENDPPA